MERLDFSQDTQYSPVEAAIHLNRYLTVKQYICGKRVLDIACGEGYGTKLIKDWGAESVVGVDISSSALQIAEEKFSGEGISFVQHNAEELPFENDSFDVVVSFETIEHLDYPECFLAEIARVVRFNGTVLLSCPNDPYYYENEENFSNPFHKRKYTWFEFKELSERFLGPAQAWYFGFGVSGFSNLPFEEIRLPEDDRPLPESMDELFSYTIPKTTGFVHPERYLNYWNASYFLGIWGENAGNMEARAVMFPKEVYSPADSPYWMDLRRWNEEYIRQRQEDEIQQRKREEAYQREAMEERQRFINEQQLSVEAFRMEKEQILATLADEKEKAEACVKGLQEQLSGLEAEIRRLQSEREQARLELEEKSREHEDCLSNMILQHQKQIAELEEERETTVRKLKEEKQQAIANWNSSLKDVSALHASCTDLQESIVTLEGALHKAEEDKLVIERTKKQELHILYIEKERTSMLLKVAETEKKLLWERIGSMENKLRDLDSEKWKAWDECTELRNELNTLKRGKVIRFLLWFWGIRDKLFGKKRG